MRFVKFLDVLDLVARRERPEREGRPRSSYLPVLKRSGVSVAEWEEAVQVTSRRSARELAIMDLMPEETRRRSGIAESRAARIPRDSHWILQDSPCRASAFATTRHSISPALPVLASDFARVRNRWREAASGLSLLVGMPLRFASRRGENQVAAHLIDELGSEGLLPFPALTADRGLGQRQPLAPLRNAPLAGNGAEIQQRMAIEPRHATVIHSFFQRVQRINRFFTTPGEPYDSSCLIERGEIVTPNSELTMRVFVRG